MKYRFTCPKLGIANRLSNSLEQVKFLRDSFWNNGALQYFSQEPKLAETFLADLAGFARETELNTSASERIAVCQVLREMTTAWTRGSQYGLYEADKQLFGTWLMHCMRAVNVTHHSSAYLGEFKTLFGDLNIPIEGNWATCEALASFEDTMFGPDTDGKFKLFVTAAGG